MVETFKIQLINCKVRIQNHVIISDSSVEISSGSFTHIKGSNGSGKTVLMATLLNLYPIKSGYRVSKYTKGSVCYIPSHFLFDDSETLAYILRFYTRIYGLSTQSLISLLTTLDLDYSTLKKQKVSDLSKGMIQKLHILPILIPIYDHYFLDEIMISLDQDTLDFMINHLKTLIDLGKTLVLIEHNLDIVDKLSQSAGKVIVIECPQ